MSVADKVNDYRENRLNNGKYVLEYTFMNELITTEPGNYQDVIETMTELFKIGMTNITIKRSL